MKPHLRSRRTHRTLLAVGMAGGLLALAACGSSSSGGSGTTPSGSSSAGGGGATSAAQISAAAAYVTAHGDGSTTIPITTPLTSKPASGKTLVFLKGDTPAATDYLNALDQAAASVGWKVTPISFQYEDPSTLISAMQDSLRLKPAAVILTGSDPALWASEVPAFESSKTPLVTIEIVGDPTMTSPIAGISTAAIGTAHGTLIGNWVISNSNGKAHALFIDIPAYAVFSSNKTSFQNTLATGCSGCSTKVLTVNLTQIANNSIPSLVVSAVRKDPSINYVVAEDGVFVTGLPAQLAAAGLSSKVTIAGTYATTAQGEDILQGKVGAFTAQSGNIEGYMAFDAVLRISEGMTLPASEYAAGPATTLLLKANIGTPTDSTNSPADYAAQFQKLWHVG